MIASYEEIAKAAQHYVNVLKNDSPIVPQSHVVRIEYRKTFNDTEYAQFDRIVDQLLKVNP